MNENSNNLASSYDILPDGWAESMLTNLVSSRKGKKPKELSESARGNSVPYIDIAAFELGKIRQYADTSSSVLVEPDDVLVVWDGARCGLAGKTPVLGALGSTLMHLKPHLILPNYLVFLLQSRFEEINTNPRGSGITHVDPELFWGLHLPIPPLEEQRRIVAKIEELLPFVNAAKERLKRTSHIMKRFRQVVLSAACSGRLTEGWREIHPQVNSDSQDTVMGYNDLPEGWHWHEAGDFYDDARYGTSVKCTYTDTGTPVLRIPNIVTGQIALSNIKYAELGKKELESLLLRAGDIIICRTNGSLDLIGKAAVVPMLPVPYAFASYLIRLRLRNESLQPEYFHIFISSQIGRNQIEGHARTTAGQFNLNLKILSELVIPVPPVAEQEEVVRHVKALFKLADIIEKRIEAARLQADKLTQSILAKAFHGEIVPTEAELARQERRSYEPAEVLLERIKVERGEKPSDGKRQRPRNI